jgi:hypothetical protein
VKHLHCPSRCIDPWGQCRSGWCRYPISSKKCIWSLFANSETAMEWTGASPHRCRQVSLDQNNGGYTLRSRNRLLSPGIRKSFCTLQSAKNPYRQSRNYSKLSPRCFHEYRTFSSEDTGTYSGIGCMFVLRRPIRTRASSPEKCIEDIAWWILSGC